MPIKVRPIPIDGRPMIGLITDSGFIIPLDHTDTMKLIIDLKRELRAARNPDNS